MRLRRDIAFAESFFVVRDFAVGHRTPMDPALLAVAEYRDRCAEKLDEIEQMQADDLDVESLIAQWRLQAAAADIRALSVRDEILLLAGSALACCSVASAVLGYFAVMVIAGVLFAGITIYIRKFAKSGRPHGAAHSCPYAEPARSAPSCSPP